MPPREEWRRYVAPAAFLLGVTIAVILVRQGLTHATSTSWSKPPDTRPSR